MHQEILHETVAHAVATEQRFGWSTPLVHQLFTLAVGAVLSVALCSASVPVDLSKSYNVANAIVKDGSQFDPNTGLNGAGGSYATSLLGTSRNFAGIHFRFGPPNATDAVSSATISLPHSKFSTLALLATGVEGNQVDQTFTVTYTDGTSKVITQSLSDWTMPQSYKGETTIIAMPHQDYNDGTLYPSPAYLYAYLFELDPSKTLESLTLPDNSSVVLLAISLSVKPVVVDTQSVSLYPYFNQTGITTDGKKFNNPWVDSGGLDGQGHAYSTTQLGPSRDFNSLTFDFGQPDIPNVISSQGQTIPLPQNQYLALNMLATSVKGATSQTFTVQYFDGSSSTFTQSFSPWLHNTPVKLAPGESPLEAMYYANSSDGTKYVQAAWIYGYTFKLDQSKPVVSVTLPNNSDVKVLALALTPIVAVPPPPSGTCGTVNGETYYRVYSSKLSTWCVDSIVWTLYAADIKKFFAYGDAVVAQDIALFKTTPQGLPFVFQADKPTGFASTGTYFGPLGDSVTGDAFYSGDFTNPVTGQNVPGFWGYLLMVHESINDFTGFVTGEWPADWWADHKSPYPNAMDEEFMRSIGKAQNNPTLLAAADAHHERFADPKQPGYDAETAMFVNFYNQFGGFSAYETTFGLIQEDGLDWSTVSPHPTPDDNTGELLSEYVIAYLQLGFHTTKDLTSTFTEAGVGTADSQTPKYTVLPSHVEAIANAHCSIESALGAGKDVSAQLSALQHGNYQNANATGGTAASCPAECSFKAGQCVALWSK